MLDKKLPYKDIIMRRFTAEAPPLPPPVLPAGFEFSMYSPGDEREWASIMESTLEFDSAEDALRFFKKEFPDTAILPARMAFVKNSDGAYAAVAAAWRTPEADGARPMVHFVSVRPEFQNLGLGKAVTLKVMQIFDSLHPGEDVLLHTQTWSHKAVCMYAGMGFRIMKTETITDENGKPSGNGFAEALEILKAVLPAEKYNMLSGGTR